jgi:RNA polymerase sigma-70 factor (ECF subfamily)
MSPGRQFQSVLVAAQSGEERALAELYGDLQPRLLRYLRGQAPADAGDLASEVWLHAARGLEQFEGDEDAFRSWFFTIAHRRLVDWRRQRARRPEAAVPNELLFETVDSTDPFSAIEEEGVLACLASLPPEQAEVVLLRVVVGLDSNEVGAVMGKKPGTIRVLQKRALERLASLVADDSRSRVTQ